MTKDELEFFKRNCTKAVQSQLRRQAYSREARRENTSKEIIRKVRTRSLDVPGSPESRIEIADHRQAAIIRACNWKRVWAVLMPVLNDKPLNNYDFYTERMAEAIQFISGKRGYNRESDEFKELAAFLWTVWKNWRDGKAKETIAAFGINPDAYRKRIERLTKDFESPEWAAYLVQCALFRGINERIFEENRSRGGILNVCFVPRFGGTK